MPIRRRKTGHEKDFIGLRLRMAGFHAQLKVLIIAALHGHCNFCFTIGGQRILQPTFDNSSPVAISIVSTSFADPPPAGFWESVFFFLSTRLVSRKLF